MSLTALVAALLAVGVLTGGAYWQGRRDGADGEKATQAREDDVVRIASAAAAASAAEAISKIRVRNTTIQNEVQREISERVVYRDCVHSPEQLQRINAALTGAESAGAGGMPASGAAR
jgi:hypothetical protein